MRDWQMVSADSHIEVPAFLWAERLPKEYREKGPQRVELPDGRYGWTSGPGQPLQTQTYAHTGGLAYKEFRRVTDDPWTTDVPGAGGPEQRIKEQDRDGVDGEILFSGGGIAAAARGADPALALECVKAYNDYIIDYNAHAPDRLFGMPIVPVNGVDAAVAELQRLAKKPNVRAVQLLRAPSGGPDLLPDDEPFWTAAEDLGIVVTSHHNFTGTGGMRTAPGFDEDRSAFMWLLSCDMETPTIPIFTILNMMLSGVFDRHPKLRLLFGETHIGWIPFWFEQMDDRYDRHHFWPNIFLPRRPSQYVKDHVRFAFLEDHVGIQLRHLIGVDTIMWSSDFPHAVGDWPYSEETVRREFEGVPSDERLKITALNFLEWMNVITPEEKEQRARQTIMREPTLAEVLPRGARRL